MILMAVGLLIFLVVCLLTFRHWQNGMVMLLVYLPFSGAVTLSLYPSPYPVLIKDFLFVIPAYLAFFMDRNRSAGQGRLPDAIILAMLALTAMVVVQSFNPDIANLMVAAIGAKVWLFYLPLLFLGYAMIKSREELVSLLRLMVVIAWGPCLVGIGQWLASMVWGYQATMVSFYGEAADGATQGFVSFDVGGTFFRIPSTFTFVTQYFGFTLAMIVPAYALGKLDSSAKWRTFSTITFWLVILASFLSGARAAYLFVPILLVLIYLLEGNLKGVLKVSVILPVALFSAMSIAGIDPQKMFNMVLELFLNYSEEIAQQGLLDAISISPFGTGTGMNTGAARYGFDDPEGFIGIENYYAKAVVELGLAGLVIVLALFLVVLRAGYRAHFRMQDSGLKSCSAAILGFYIIMLLNNFKGWQIDLDPINVYFWLFSGVMLKLGYLDRLRGEAAQMATAIPVKLSGKSFRRT